MVKPLYQLDEKAGLKVSVGFPHFCEKSTIGTFGQAERLILIAEEKVFFLRSKKFGGLKMKKWMICASLLAGLIFGFASSAKADEGAPAGNDDKPGMGQNTGDEHEGMDGGAMGGRLDKMKEKLSLTDSQVSQLKTLFKKQMENNKPLRDQERIDMDTLQQEVDANASDADIKKLLDKLDGERKTLQSSREKMTDQLRTILTPSQQAKMVLGMRQKGMGMMGKWMRKHKGMHDTNGDPKEGVSDNQGQ